MIRNLALIALVLSLGLVLPGCGGTCRTQSVRVMPQSDTADHNSAPPGDSVAFTAWGSGGGSGCSSTAANLGTVVWSVSDTVNVSISNAQDVTFGVATCVGPTSGPVTITATLPADKNAGKTVSGSAQLTCN